jgi:GNAT superfamily N-acetyltransferase
MSVSPTGKLIALVRELGWLNAALYALDRVSLASTGRRFVVRYYLVAQPVPERPLVPARLGRSVVVRRLEPGDPGFAGLPLTEQTIRYRFAQNSICFAAFKNGESVGCLWLCLGIYVEDEIRCRFEPWPAGQAVWDYDVYVHPEHRQGLVFARLWDEANAYLRTRGIGWSVSRISAFNPKSLSSHARLGATVCGVVTAFCAGKLQVAIATLPPAVDVSAGRGQGPVFRIPVPAEPAKRRIAADAS